MKAFKLLLICFLLFTTSAFSEILKFGNATYNGGVKKGKAHGVGVFTFADGTKYQGKFSKNRFHGNGKYIDSKGNVFDGKWKYGKLYNKIDFKTREVVKLSFATGKSNFIQIRGTGNAAQHWFEAKPIEVANTAEIEPLKELDFFDQPSIFSPAYGDEKKIQEILDRKNVEIELKNDKTGQLKQNLKTIYVLTAKGERDQKITSRSIIDGGDKDSTHSSSGTVVMSGGGVC